jgi:hypothetical protein
MMPGVGTTKALSTTIWGSILKVSGKGGQMNRPEDIGIVATRERKSDAKTQKGEKWKKLEKAKDDAHYQNRTDDLIITSDTLYH